METMNEQERYITEIDIRNAPDYYVFVFGDNFEHTGYSGQAKVARQFVRVGKAFGIPTKRKPTNGDDAFFADRDDEIRAVRRAFAEIRQLKRVDGKHIVFFPHIGEGLAELPGRSPIIYGMIRGFVSALSA